MLNKAASIKTSASSALGLTGSLKEKLSRQSSELSLNKTILIQSNSKRKSVQQIYRKSRKSISDKAASNIIKFGQTSSINSVKIDPVTGLRSILKRKTLSCEKNQRHIIFADEIDESFENDINSEYSSPRVNRSRFISPVKSTNKNLLLNNNIISMRKSIDNCLIRSKPKKKKLVEVIEVVSYRNFDLYSNGKSQNNESNKKEKEHVNCSCACYIF